MPLRGENGFEVDPALDDVIGIFASRRCRCVLYYFLDTDSDTSSLDELCDYVLTHDPEASEETSVTTGLYHTTLPKLEEFGVIDYDDRSETIRFRGAREWEPILSSIREVEAEQC